MNWTTCQHMVEKLRPYIGFTYPLLRKVSPRALTVSRQASFLTTNRCNDRCNFCMVAPYFDDPRMDLTLDKFKVIARNIHLERFYNICLSGAGEPLLNEDTLPIIRFVNDKYPLVKVFLTTNGIALGDFAVDLSKLKIAVLSVSVNAARPDVYRKTMQVDQFDNVVDNIQRYKELAPGDQTMMSFVAHKRNITDLGEFIILARHLGISKVTARYAKFYKHRSKMGDLQETDSLFYHQELSDLCFNNAKNLANLYGIEMITADDPPFGCDFPRRLCHFPFTDVLVGMNGEVFPCCGGETIFKNKVASGEYDFGNALRDPIEKWQNNKLWQKARKYTLPECNVCAIGVTWDGHIKKRHIMEWG